MIKKIKNIVRKFLYMHRATQESYIKYLRDNGAHIGERVRIFDPHTTLIDATRPWMISIGNDVQITSGVTILTHGYDWSVLKGIYGDVLGSCGEVTIGNNCFIGMHSTILKGVHIGNNCVVGANSLVNHDIEDGWGVAGNPAKPIMKIEDYYIKRKTAQLSEAKELYQCYVKRFHKEPSAEIFDEFFWLFKRRCEKIEGGAMQKMHLVGNFVITRELFENTEPMFDGYEEFLKHMRKNTI